MSANVGDCIDELVGRTSRTEGGHLSIGRAGFTLHYDRGCTLSGYDCERMKALCLARGLPVIDSRTVPFEAVWKLAVSGPMTAVGHAADEPPRHALSYVPLRIVVEAYRMPAGPPQGSAAGLRRPGFAGGALAPAGRDAGQGEG